MDAKTHMGVVEIAIGFIGVGDFSGKKKSNNMKYPLKSRKEKKGLLWEYQVSIRR